ncbi:MAG: CBS domain-containing protein [Gemmatimonadota bacterium]|nr:CBS domain-containing protein [Gemmatimonadota bacterium]
MLKLRAIMSEDVVTVSPEATIRDAIEILRADQVSGIPVVSGERVVGVLSVSDVLDFEVETPSVPAERSQQVEWGGLEDEEADPGLAAEAGETPPAAFFIGMWADAGADVRERFDAVEGPEWDRLGDYAVSEAMTTSVYALPPDTEVPEAAAYMLEAGIHRVLVMEDSRLLGIVSSMDIVRAVAERRL